MPAGSISAAATMFPGVSEHARVITTRIWSPLWAPNLFAASRRGRLPAGFFAPDSPPAGWSPTESAGHRPTSPDTRLLRRGDRAPLGADGRRLDPCSLDHVCHCITNTSRLASRPTHSRCRSLRSSRRAARVCDCWCARVMARGVLRHRAITAAAGRRSVRGASDASDRGRPRPSGRPLPATREARAARRR